MNRLSVKTSSIVIGGLALACWSDIGLGMFGPAPWSQVIALVIPATLMLAVKMAGRTI